MQKQKKSSVLFIVFFLLFYPVLCNADNHSVRLFTILHTNDIHGTVWPDNTIGGLSSFKTLVFLEQGRAIASGLPLFIFDCGDFFQGTPLGDFTEGEGVMKVMKEIGYDAATIGNHEFDISLEKLIKLFQLSSHPYILSNLRMPDGKKIPLTLDSLLIKKGSITLGVFGLMTPSLPSLSSHSDSKRVRILDPVAVAKKQVSDLKRKGADIIVVLSHLGIEEDRVLAQKVKGIDIILGGHSHTALSEPVSVGGTLIFQSIAYGKGAGRYRFAYDRSKPSNERLKLLKAELLPLEKKKFYPSQRFLENTKDFINRIDSQMSQIIGTTKVELVDTLPGEYATQKDKLEYFLKNHTGQINARKLPSGEYFLLETNLANMVCDIIREKAKTDIAFLNSGSVRALIPAGEISYGKIYKTLPFSNLIVKTTLTGEQIYSLLSMRGRTKLKAPVISGMKVIYTLDSNNNITVKKILRGNEELSRSKKYTLATNNFLARGGDGYSIFTEIKEKEETEICVRDTVIDYIRNNSPVEYYVDNRVSFE